MREEIEHTVMTSQPVISIIVPVYNTEKYLRRCIDSILAQTYTDWELLLIDDGSKDSSGIICDEYAAKDTRIRVFHKENGGVSSARNLGLDNAQGEWVTFCDSDDWVEERWLTVFVENIREADIVICGIRFISQKSVQEYGLDYSGAVSSALIHLSKYRLLGYLFNKCFQRSIIQENNIYFDERIVFKEDEEFFFRYLKCIVYVKSVEEILYNYECPDLRKKYIVVDNFWVNLSLYKSIRNLISPDNYLYDEYLRSACNAFFAGFPACVSCLLERRRRLECFSVIINTDINRIENLGFLSKYFLLHPSYLSILFFQLKSIVFLFLRFV